VEQHAALGRDVVGEQRLERPEADAEQRLAPERSHGDAAGAVVDRVDVVFAARIVELLGGRVDEHVLLGEVAEVDARLVDREIDRRLGRQVLDEEDGQPLGRDLVDRAQRDAVAVREGEVLVDQVRLGRLFELARAREHDLPCFAIDPVAVVVGRDEVVMRRISWICPNMSSRGW
jgi:hypothetical protein